MAGKQGDSLGGRGIKRSLNRRILRNTTLNILILVVICCVIMALSLQSLANNILLDSLQPMARQSPKTEQARQENFGIVVVDMAHCNHEGSQTETV